MAEIETAVVIIMLVTVKRQRPRKTEPCARTSGVTSFRLRGRVRQSDKIAIGMREDYPRIVKAALRRASSLPSRIPDITDTSVGAALSAAAEAAADELDQPGQKEGDDELADHIHLRWAAQGLWET